MIGIDPVPLFPLGETTVTPGAARRLDMGQVKLAIARHASGDRGEMEADDRRLNDERVAKGGTLASIYQTAAGVRIYIITDPGHTRTTVLLPEEY